jgi:archaellum component FlaC
MQMNKKIYTTLIITVLTLSMVLTVVPAALAITIDTFPMGNTGAPGDLRMVAGTADTVGGLIQVFMDEVHDWDGETGFLGQGYAPGGSYSIAFFVPEVPGGPHNIIVLDVEEDSSSAATFTILSGITIDPDVGLVGDTISVQGEAFNPGEYITMYYWDGTAYQTLTTSPLMPLTNSKGTFTCTFAIPADAANAADNIMAEDETGFTAYATLDVGPYITVTPEHGLADSSVTVQGRGFTANGLVDIEWLIGGSYITVSNDVTISAGGTFTTSFAVPLLPSPIPPGTDYTIRATDNGSPAVVELTTFTLIETAAITLTPNFGHIGTSVQVDGTWYTPNELVTVTFDGDVVGSTVSDAVDGSWSVTFLVPEVINGPHTVNATDAEGVTDAATFTITSFALAVTTRATQYYQGDIISLYTASNEPLTFDVYWEITDLNGVAFDDGYILSGDWNMISPGNYMVPYYYASSSMLPSDAVLGTWNFTAYNAATMAIVDTNLFTVVAIPTQQDVLDKLDDLEGTIQDIVTTSEGTIKALINTKSGQIMTSLDAIGPQLQAITDTAVIIATDVGEVKTDIASLDLGTMGVDITAIKNDVATIKTNIGTVDTAVSNLDAKVSSVQGDIATVQTTLGTLEGKITSIEGTTATIQTDVGTLQADVADVPSKVDMTPAWIAVVLALIAAIAAIFAVITIRQKIAG